MMNIYDYASKFNIDYRDAITKRHYLVQEYNECLRTGKWRGPKKIRIIDDNTHTVGWANKDTIFNHV